MVLEGLSDNFFGMRLVRESGKCEFFLLVYMYFLENFRNIWERGRYFKKELNFLNCELRKSYKNIICCCYRDVFVKYYRLFRVELGK